MLADAIAPTDPQEPARVSRTDLLALAEQLAVGRRIEGGCVTVIGLDAIRQRLAERWPRKREQVWEAFERMIERRLPPTALWARINETDYLVEAGSDAAQAQATSFKLLREAHQFFLGEQRLSAMRVDTVTAYADGRLTRCPVPPPRQLDDPPEARSFDPQPGAADAAPPTNAGRWSALSFVAAGQNLQIGFEHQPIIQLSTGKAFATRLRPVIMLDERVRPAGMSLDGLDHVDLIAIDEAIMAEALTQGGIPTVVPLFFETVSSTRGRARLLRAVAGSTPHKHLMVELVGVDGGTPHGRLLETVSLLLPYCAGVIARAPAGKPCASIVRGARLAGLSVECEDGPRARLAPATMLADCKAQLEPSRRLFAFGLPTVAALTAAREAGATHASLSSVALPTP